ncbi:host specificity factor TipJ family phage tail protein [Acinetobacter sp.]|uniref:host specificity factor TipJ family phage tail protein n=1 Tax=Acinetobacter sp. TaxID=472 RepID=UPI0026492279|nr:host specificity factor TipJ family phage tail protein [Acinetobacter sp.]MDN5511173.1 hypothetical protein [Acinetobacter sp.]MDN5523934.1 hypothetical protein [Acinetobacter sp.]
MKQVHIRRDPFNKDTWTTASTDDICAYLSEQFTVFPENARIYYEAIAQKNDVTPIDERGIRHLQSLDGEFYVVVYPAYDPITIIYWAVVAITAAFSIYTYMTMPKPPTGIDQSSANNDLGQRQNKTRVGGRIPDIFGLVKAYPDLISPAYRYYENNTEIEEVLMCLGNGHYDVSNFKEGDTSISQIPGMSVSSYDPGMDITTNNPTYRYGEVLNYSPLIAKRSVSIVDRELPQPNTAQAANSTMTFTSPNIINISGTSFTAGAKIILDGAVFGIADAVLSGTTDIDYTNKVLTVATTANITDPQNYKMLEIQVLSAVDPVNGTLNIAGNYPVLNIVKSGSFVYEIYLDTPEKVNQNWLLLTEDNSASMSSVLTKNTANIDLDGEYTISSVETDKIILSAPDATNPDWLKINGTIGGEWVVLYGSTDNWQGWYEAYGEYDSIIVNFYAPQGLYYIGKKGWKGAINVVVAVEYQQINDNGIPIGLSILQQATMYGWSGGGMTEPIGISMKHEFPFTGNVRYRVRKVTVILNNGNTNVHNVTCRSVFLCSKLNKLSYEDVTIIRAKTVNNDVASGVRERMLNCMASRKLPLNGTGALTTTRSAAQALIYLALDKRNGRRNLSEVDVAQILAEEQKLVSYFNNPKAAEFSYTFDDSNLSFEEIAGMVTSSCFCEPTRFGSKLRMKFEKPQSNAVLLFNHRNKVPKSEKRTYSFGVSKDYDGVEIEYTSPVDDARETYSIPEDGSARNPLSIKTTGIRTIEQAKTRAWREWNKLIYQRVSCTFDGLDESSLLARNDAILVADNTVMKTQDGEVESVDGLILTLSQAVDVASGSSIYLQLYDGSVDIIGCQAGEFPNHLILNRAPLLPLVVDHDRYAKTTYQIVSTVNTRKDMFLLTEMTPQSKMTNSLTCVNYDSRYYEKDHSFF